MSLKSFENSGLLVLNAAKPRQQKTVVVIGLARSGTSLVAGSLHELGVWMGAKAPPPVYEDMALGAAIESGDMAAARKLIRDYDATHAVWGWKRPASLHQIDTLHGLLRNPLYVVIFRDVFAIANRNRVSVGSDVLRNMRRSVDEYGKLLDFLESTRPAALLVSYDKALRHKETFIDQLCDFLGLPADTDTRRKAVAFITPSPEAYLKGTRAGRVVGHLDVVREDLVFGWAAQHPAGRHTAAVEVMLEVDGREVATTRADLARPDLVQQGAHRTGKAGFAFHLEGNEALRGGAQVRVFAGAERDELNNSPWRLESRATSAKLDTPASERANRPTRPLVFLHIPKTAGTSLRALFREHVKARQLAVLDPPISPEARARVAKATDELRLLMGHLYFGIDAQLGFVGDYVTFLRHPVARVASFWKHQATHRHAEFHPEAQRGMSLREFVESERTLQTDNHMTRILVGTAEKGLLDGSRKRIEDSRYLDQALTHVRERFCFVGFMEYYAASIAALRETLGWADTPTTDRKLNVLNSTAEELDSATIDAIQRHNALDIALFERLVAETPWLNPVRNLAS